MEDITTDWLYEPRTDAGMRFLEDDGNWRMTKYAELAGKAWAMAEVLRERGLAGERLGVIAETSEDCVVQTFAVVVTGGTCVPLPHFLPRLDESQQWADLSAHILSTGRPRAVLQRRGGLAVDGWEAAQVPRFDELTTLAPGRVSQSAAPTLIQFTSGSTGPAKLVRTSRRALNAALHSAQQMSELTPQDTTVIWTPWWFLPMMFSTASLQADIFMMTPAQFLADPATWLRCIGKLGCTTTAAPSFGYQYTLNNVSREDVADCRFDHCRRAFINAEPLRARDIDGFVDRFGPLGFRREAFCPAYGLSESTLTASHAPIGRGPVLRPGDVGPDALVGVGRAVPGCERRVLLEDGRDAPEGEVGEIHIGGDNVADGYEPGPDFDEWVPTGDAGSIQDGELFVLGRIDDSFSCLGERFLVPEAEARIHARIVDAMAVAVVPARADGAGITVVVESASAWPDERAGQMAKTVSGLFRGVEVDLLVVVPGGIPRTAGGKPLRRECFSRYVAGRPR